MIQIDIKIAFTLIVIGLALCLLNAALQLPMNRLKYHLYSTILVSASVMYLIMRLIWSI